MFTVIRLAGSAPSCSAAASPRLRRRHSPWPRGRSSKPTSESCSWSVQERRAPLPSPYPPGLELVPCLSGLNHWFTFVTPFCLACRARTVWQCRPVPALSGLLAVLPSASSVRLPSASPDCCDSPEGWVSHPPPVTRHLMAHRHDTEGVAAMSRHTTSSWREPLSPRVEQATYF